MSHDGNERRTTPLTDAQLGLIRQQTERAATKVLKKHVRNAAVGFAILLIVALFAGHGYIDALHDGLIGSCERVNVLRAQSNQSDLVSFHILSISAQREDGLSKVDNAGTQATHTRSAKLLYGQARTLTVTALTDCDKAVGDPSHYAAPVANPIGDPKTGILYENVDKIKTDSARVLAIEQQRANNG